MVASPPALALHGLERFALSAVIRRVRTGQLDSVNPVPCVSVELSLCESCMRQNRTCSLSGGRWSARKRATSDPTPTKCPNNGGRPPAEGIEGRRPTKENIAQATAPRTQSRTSASSDLLGVREAASRDKRARFTALLHHVTTKLLMGSFYALKREAAPGVDGVTWQEYETDLDEKLVDLCLSGCFSTPPYVGG